MPIVASSAPETVYFGQNNGGHHEANNWTGQAWDVSQTHSMRNVGMWAYASNSGQSQSYIFIRRIIHTFSCTEFVRVAEGAPAPLALRLSRRCFSGDTPASLLPAFEATKVIPTSPDADKTRARAGALLAETAGVLSLLRPVLTVQRVA